MIQLETHVRIERPVEEVFTYVAEPRNLPRWNSAVQVVRESSPVSDGSPGSTYAMERSLPTGRAANELEIVARERPGEFAIRTISGPTPFGYRFRFSPDEDATVVEVDAEADLGVAAELLGPLARRAVKQGVDRNLATLKTILESGTDRF